MSFRKLKIAVVVPAFRAEDTTKGFVGDAGLGGIDLRRHDASPEETARR
jgi:hypothetical protein